MPHHAGGENLRQRMSARTKISTVIITFNEEKKVERCLRSLNWVDEIIVVDSFSTDRTVEICRRYTDNVHQRPWPNNYAKQRQIADQFASNDWILALDADEVVTKGLRDDIVSLFEQTPGADCYGIPRWEYLSGKFIMSGGWYPQHKYILYRKSLGEWAGGPAHLFFKSRGKVDYLNNPILHDGAPTFKIFMDKFNHFSSVEARADYERGGRFSLFRAVFKPLERFFGRYIRHKGYKDGVHGFYMAAVVAINYFLREMKIYEQRFVDARHGNSWDEVYIERAVGGADSRNP